MSQHYNIEKYYALSDTLMTRFLDAYEQKKLDDAYTYGLRYVHIAMEVIPSHGYYSTAAHRRNKEASVRMSGLVLEHLESLVEKMDEEETERAKDVRRRLEAEAKENVRLNKIARIKAEEEAIRTAEEKYLPAAPVFDREWGGEEVEPSEPSAPRLGFEEEGGEEKGGDWGAQEIPPPPPPLPPSAPPPFFGDGAGSDEEGVEEGSEEGSEAKGAFALPPPLPPPSYDVATTAGERKSQVGLGELSSVAAGVQGFSVGGESGEGKGEGGGGEGSGSSISPCVK